MTKYTISTPYKSIADIRAPLQYPNVPTNDGKLCEKEILTVVATDGITEVSIITSTVDDQVAGVVGHYEAGETDKAAKEESCLLERPREGDDG